MRRYRFVTSIVLLGLLLSTGPVVELRALRIADATPAESSEEDLAEETSSLSSPLMFIENVGQFDENARFQVCGANSTIWLTEDAVWVTVFEQGNEKTEKTGGGAPPHLHTSTLQPRSAVNLKLSFVGADPHPRLEPFNRLESHVSYFIGDDPANWHADVPVWGGVRYVELYPGVDLELTGDGWRLGCHVAGCKSALQNVRLRVAGTETLSTDDSFLYLTTAAGDLMLPLLTVTGATPSNSPTTFDLGRQVFEVAYPFSTVPLISRSRVPLQESSIGLLYATFLGGSDDDNGLAITVDETGNTYLTGYTWSPSFPTTMGAFDRSYNGEDFLGGDAFVVKVSTDGTRLIYATFLGGSNGDGGAAIAADGAGNAYVAGWTGSSNFPATAGAYDRSYNGGSSDAFLVKLNEDGTALVYATFLGGSQEDGGAVMLEGGGDERCGIAVDKMGSAYVTGWTLSPNFPTTAGAFDTSHNGFGNAFVVKMNAQGTTLVYATFLGGGGSAGTAIALDDAGNAYVTGHTASSSFPTTVGAFDTTHGGGICGGEPFIHPCPDAFLAKLNSTGARLIYATFLGGNNWDEGSAIAVDGAGNAYVTGWTQSPNFPTTAGALDIHLNGDVDVFVVQVNAGGTGLIYATFLGGNGYDYGYAASVDRTGATYVTGWTGSLDFPITPGAYDTSHNGFSDVFASKLAPGGASLSYSTFIGGNQADFGRAVAVDRAGTTYVTGGTYSPDFPTTSGAYDRSHNGNADVFVTKLIVGEPLFCLQKQSMPTDGLRNNGTLTYTLTLSGPSLNVLLWDPLPVSVQYVTGSVTPPAVYSPTARAVVWQGTLPTDTAQIIRFQVTPGITGTGALSLSLPIVNTAWLTSTQSGIGVSAAVIVNGFHTYLPAVMR